MLKVKILVDDKTVSAVLVLESTGVEGTSQP